MKRIFWWVLPIFFIPVLAMAGPMIMGGGGSGTPGGSGGNGGVQFNDSGSFGSSKLLKFNKATGNLQVRTICGNDGLNCVAWPPSGSGDVLKDGNLTSGMITVGTGTSGLKASSLSVNDTVRSSAVLTSEYVLKGAGGRSALPSTLTVNDTMRVSTYDPTGVAADAFSADNTKMYTLPGATYTTVQQGITFAGSSGAYYYNSPSSNDSAGTYSISSGSGWLREGTSGTANLVSFDYDGNDSIHIADGEVQYITLEFLNSPANPVIAKHIGSRPATIDGYQVVELAVATREGNHIHVFNTPDDPGNGVWKGMEKARHVDGIQSAEGSVLSTSSRNVVLTSGEFYYKNKEFVTQAVDTSAATRCSVYVQASLNDSAMQDFPNTKYQLGGTLSDLTILQYGFLDVWEDIDSGTNGNDTCAIVYGTANVATIADAQVGAIAVDMTNIPNRLKIAGKWRGRIIFQKSASSSALVEIPTTTNVTAGAATNHNNLSNVQNAGADVTYGHVTDAVQTIVGEKTFTGQINGNDSINVPKSEAYLVGGYNLNTPVDTGNCSGNESIDTAISHYFHCADTNDSAARFIFVPHPGYTNFEWAHVQFSSNDSVSFGTAGALCNWGNDSSPGPGALNSSTFSFVAWSYDGWQTRPKCKSGHTRW